MTNNEYTDKEYAEQEKKDMHYTRHYLPSEVRLKKGKDQPNPAETTYFDTHMRTLYQRMYDNNHKLAKRNNQRLPYNETRRYKRRDEGAIIEYQNGHGLEELVVFDVRRDVLLCINHEGIVRELPHGLKRAERIG